jgi:teichuronic acid biosynthesis glycosyltransferase TuaC
MNSKLKVLVLSFLYPSDVQPVAGVFMQERLRYLKKIHEVFVISPQPWSPIDWLIRIIINKQYRQSAYAGNSYDAGIRVFRPKFLSLPGMSRLTDSASMSLTCLLLIWRQKRLQHFDLIDAQFSYPEGHAAKLLAWFFQVPFGITLHGDRDLANQNTSRERLLRSAFREAAYIVCVSNALKNFAVQMGAEPRKVVQIPNGINPNTFFQVDRFLARNKLRLPVDAPIIVSVGSLIPLKGQRRLIEQMPQLIKLYPNIRLLIIGGPTNFSDTSKQLSEQIQKLGLETNVQLVGQVKPDKLLWYLSAANVFALTSDYEGWPNVLMEALACGLPVIAHSVGGNAEIICSTKHGTLVEIDQPEQLRNALLQWLEEQPYVNDRLAFAQSLTWEVCSEKVDIQWCVAVERAHRFRHFTQTKHKGKVH